MKAEYRVEPRGAATSAEYFWLAPRMESRGDRPYPELSRTLRGPPVADESALSEEAPIFRAAGLQPSLRMGACNVVSSDDEENKENGNRGNRSSPTHSTPSSSGDERGGGMGEVPNMEGLIRAEKKWPQ